MRYLGRQRASVHTSTVRAVVINNDVVISLAQNSRMMTRSYPTIMFGKIQFREMVALRITAADAQRSLTEHNFPVAVT